MPAREERTRSLTRSIFPRPAIQDCPQASANVVGRHDSRAAWLQGISPCIGTRRDTSTSHCLSILSHLRPLDRGRGRRERGGIAAGEKPLDPLLYIGSKDAAESSSARQCVQKDAVIDRGDGVGTRRLLWHLAEGYTLAQLLAWLDPSILALFKKKP